jgi:integrase/recombinase XerD
MPTFRLVLLEHKAHRNGECPIYLRITEDRKTKYMSTGITLQPNHWNDRTEKVRKSNRSYETFNLHLDEFKSKAKEAWLNLRNGNRGGVSAAMIKDELSGKNTVDFFSFFDGIIDDLDKREYILTVKKFITTRNKLRNFLDGQSIDFDNITPSFLRKFETYLRTEERDKDGKVIRRKNKTNTVHKAMETIKRCFNIAIDEGIVSAEVFPFRTYKVKRERTEKTHLSFSQIRCIIELDLKPGTALWHTRNYFMFSFYCCGVRFSDICTLQWKNIQGDRLKYKMGKTGADKDVLLTQPPKDILSHYRPSESQKPDNFVFPLLWNDRDYSDLRYLKKQISSRNVITNNNLKEIARLADINDNISFHVSRHSWADYARRKGMSVYSISKVLAHSSLKTTEGYLKSFDTDGVDAELLKLYD